jgi:DNA-binding NarL/FixJ family response regulator
MVVGKPDHPAEPGVVFTAREKALVELLAAGHTDASAARRLGVSPRTVSYTLQSLMDRLAVENRFQLGLALGTLGATETPDGSAAGPDVARDRPPDSIEDGE